MIYCFDVDGTICTNTNGDYEKAEPFRDIIRTVNVLFDEGNTIYFYTARGSTTGIDWKETTERQLGQWGVKYHRLFLGKPTADVYVDDKCINTADWMKARSSRRNWENRHHLDHPSKRRFERSPQEEYQSSARVPSDCLLHKSLPTFQIHKPHDSFHGFSRNSVCRKTVWCGSSISPPS